METHTNLEIQCGCTTQWCQREGQRSFTALWQGHTEYWRNYLMQPIRSKTFATTRPKSSLWSAQAVCREHSSPNPTKQYSCNHASNGINKSVTTYRELNCKYWMMTITPHPPLLLCIESGTDFFLERWCNAHVSWTICCTCTAHINAYVSQTVCCTCTAHVNTSWAVSVCHDLTVHIHTCIISLSWQPYQCT